MPLQSHDEKSKVKVTIECTLDERMYIKMLAARAHQNLSEFILSYVRSDFPKSSRKQKRTPNKETLKAHQEALKGAGVTCKNLDSFWKEMGVLNC